MRIRRKKWARPELDECEYFINEPKEMKNKWKECFKNDNPMHLELGCGKGVFLAELAYQNPNINYIAIDIKSDILGYARRNVEELYTKNGKKVENIVLTAYNIEQILDILGKEDKIERIYINFCNPWPKAKHNKRRLTHPKQLDLYKTFLRENGEIHFKTDDDDLYVATLRYFEEANFELIYNTQNLHQDTSKNNILTEHEIMFMQKGIPIKAIIANYVNKTVRILEK